MEKFRNLRFKGKKEGFNNNLTHLWVIKKKVSPSLLLACAARAMSLIIILSSSGLSSELLLLHIDTSVMFFSTSIKFCVFFSSLYFFCIFWTNRVLGENRGKQEGMKKTKIWYLKEVSVFCNRVQQKTVIIRPRRVKPRSYEVPLYCNVMPILPLCTNFIFYFSWKLYVVIFLGFKFFHFFFFEK